MQILITQPTQIRFASMSRNQNIAELFRNKHLIFGTKYIHLKIKVLKGEWERDWKGEWDRGKGNERKRFKDKRIKKGRDI